MTKSQMIITDGPYNIRRVRAALIWKVEPVEQKPTADIRTINVVARPKEVVPDSSEGAVQFAWAA